MPVFRFWAISILLLCSGVVQAGQIALVLGAPEPVFREFIQTFKAGLQGSNWQVSWEGGNEQFVQSPPAGADLVLALGGNALRAALNNPAGPPVMAAMLTRAAHEATLREFPVHKAGVSALYLDQPMARQLAFLQRLFPDATRVVSLVSARNAELAVPLKRQALSAGLKTDVGVVASDELFVPTLERVLGEDAVFLALPDAVLFSRDNIRAFLLTTYRYRRPVIAFSAPFVQAGALAALYTTPVQVAQELAQWLARQKGGPVVLPPAQGPARFSIQFNPQVARTLNISLPSESDVLSALPAKGGER